jgi:hypothetical protein
MVPIFRLWRCAKVRQTGHGAVVLHHLADHACRGQAGQPGDIDRGLGMPGPDQHPALAGAQREHMPRRGDIGRAGIGVDGDRDRARPVMR